jgi:hypothetical protein
LGKVKIFFLSIQKSVKDVALPVLPWRFGWLCGDRVSGKKKLICLASGLRLKVRKRYANESNAFGRREDRPDQVKGELM